MMDTVTKTISLLFIGLCALCWGPSYLFIKIAVPDIPPITLVLLRVAIGAFLLCLICAMQKQNIFKWKQYWKEFFVMGILLNVLPFTLISYGELYISSALTGILNSLTLIFTAVLSHYFGTREPLTKSKIVGISLGLVGLVIIYLPLVMQEEVKSNVGTLLLVCSCFSYATGTVYARSHLHKVPGIIALTFQLILATCVLIPFSLIVDRPFSLPFPPYPAIIGVLSLGVIGTAAGFYFYYKAIKLAGATYASLSLFFVPILAMALGSVVLHEPLNGTLYLGTFFILIGVLAVNPAFSHKAKK